jgi:hypothetical protein
MQTPDELKNLARKAVQQRDRFILGVAQSQRRELSRAKKRELSRTAIIHSPMEGRGSLFKYLSPYWRALTDMEKQVWRDAAVPSGLTGWTLFISDNAARIKNSLTFPVPPSDLWQVRAGRLVIEAPASEIILQQIHPQKYLVAQKIPGTPWKQRLVEIAETFGFPLTLAIRYKSDLTPEGGTQSARYYARVWTSYQGQDVYYDFEIPFSESTDWTYEEIEATVPRGIIIGYTLFLEIVGYRGTLMFDNIRAIHGGTNWARDPRCDDISKTFSKAFALVPPFWVPVSLPSGASYSSIFPPVLE